MAELSSYQIATTTELHPRVAVLLNITPDHLGWHKSHKNYALAKIKLFDNMVDDDLVVVDVEDAGIHEFDEYIYTPGRRICKVAFDEPEGEDVAFVRDGKMIVRLKGVETPLIATSELKISGHHNVINALCAATAVLAVGANPEAFAAVWPRSSRSSTAWSRAARLTECATSTIPRRPTPTRSRRR